MKPLVVCVKVGSKYGPEYVNRLAQAVRWNTFVKHDFLCVTDDPSGVECATVSPIVNLPGWWNKLFLFAHPELAGRRVIFLDLDTIIVNQIDWLLTYEGRFAILRDFYHSDGYGSAIMSWQPNFGRHIWTTFEAHPDAIMAALWGDQEWIRQQIHEVDFWQKLYPDAIQSYKAHNLAEHWPSGSIVCFHGEPRPHQVSDPWMKIHWSNYDNVVLSN